MVYIAINSLHNKTISLLRLKKKNAPTLTEKSISLFKLKN